MLPVMQRSFVPPKPIRALRNLTQYRKAQIGERQREANRLHKILEDTGIKLDCVASDILGASGRAMLDALVAGTTDPQVLAELAKGKLRKKIPALREALVGYFDRQHALIVSAILAHLDFLDEQIQLLSDEIEAQLAPFAKAVELLCTIPGVQRRTAEAVLAEIGTDMRPSPPTVTSPAEPASAPATTAPPANAGLARPAMAPSDSTPPSPKPHSPRLARPTSTSARNTSGCVPDAATAGHSAPSSTRSCLGPLGVVASHLKQESLWMRTNSARRVWRSRRGGRDLR